VLATTKDEFRYISIAEGGQNYEFMARIDCMDDPGGSGYAGVMIRDTYDVYSAHALFALSTEPPPLPAIGFGTLKGVMRKSTKSTTTSATFTLTASQIAVDTLPIYLKIVRAGTNLSFQKSSDGVNFIEVGTRTIGTNPMTGVDIKSTTPYYGLVMTGNGAGTALAGFREVSGPEFTPGPQLPDPPTGVGAVGQLKQIVVSWTAPAQAPEKYVIFRASDQAGPYSVLAEVDGTVTSHTNSGLTDETKFCYKVRSKVGALESLDSNSACATTLPQPKEIFKRGDADGNGALEVTDPILVLNYQFVGGPAPECFDAADIDDLGPDALDLTDAIYSLNYQFVGGYAPPPSPGPTTCGPDPTPDQFPPCVYPSASCGF
jgi:hypothetical protein